jgi:O-antigen ligase
VIVYALYAYFNKGIAYSFLVEGLLVLGLLLVVWERRSYVFIWNRKVMLLVFFVLLTGIYIVRGIVQKYNLMDVIRDSFMLNYIAFVFIIFLFKDQVDYLVSKLANVYKWYPLVACCSFLMVSYIPFFADFTVFGDIVLLHYKYSDMAVHLFITTLFLLNGNIKLEKRFLLVNAVLIAYLFLVASSYSRSGMVSYIVSFAVFVFTTQNKALKQQILSSLKFVPVIVLIALPFYLSTKVEENFQGRKLGLSQINENINSIVNPDNTDGSLADNKVWRLVWWGKIIDYTFAGPYFLNGKGLGMSLAVDDEIPMAEEELRAPHNFHLDILARFGVPVFFLWLYWLFLNLKGMRTKDLDSFQLILQVIFLMFILNASFDVFLEGPMGAFPFWTFVGIAYVKEEQTANTRA